jgi:hypothetical protein
MHEVKRPYLAPTVTDFGKVAKLTAAGSQGNQEQGDPTPSPAKKL